MLDTSKTPQHKIIVYIHKYMCICIIDLNQSLSLSLHIYVCIPAKTYSSLKHETHRYTSTHQNRRFHATRSLIKLWWEIRFLEAIPATCCRHTLYGEALFDSHWNPMKRTPELALLRGNICFLCSCTSFLKQPHYNLDMNKKVHWTAIGNMGPVQTTAVTTSWK